MNVPTRRRQLRRLETNNQQWTRPDQGQNVPLGTAELQTNPSGVVRTFRPGDFFLGFTSHGYPVGIDDDRHINVTSGTRSGKGASVIMQNLIHWLGSVVVIDPKGENAMVTARRRGQGSRFADGLGQTVKIIDPFDAVHTEHDDFAELKARFNPLDMLSADREESVDDAARIAEALIVTENSSDPFFEESARIVLKALMLHVATWHQFEATDRNLVTVRRLLMEGDAATHAVARQLAGPGDKVPSAFSLLFTTMQRNAALGGVIANAAGMLIELDKSPRTLASIMQVARTNTEFLDSSAIRRCVAISDFSLSELKTSRQGLSLYICLPQRFMESHFRWQRMMATLTITEMERVRGRPATGYRTLIVLDEFPALRRMKVIENAAAQIAGYGVKLMFVSQTLAQLKDIYKDNWETLLANAGAKLFFCNDDHFTRDYVCKLAGEREVVRIGQSKNQTSGKATGSSSSFTTGSSSSSSSSSSWGGANRFGMPSGSSTSGSSVSHSSSSTSTSSRSETESESEGYSESVQKRYLLNPDEVGRLFGDRDNPTALALITGQQPMFLTRQYYYRTRELAGLYDPHPDHGLPMTRLDAQRQIADERRRHAEQEALRRQAELEADRRRQEAEAERQRQYMLGLEASARQSIEFEREQRRRFVLLCLIGFPALATCGIGLPIALSAGYGFWVLVGGTLIGGVAAYVCFDG